MNTDREIQKAFRWRKSNLPWYPRHGKRSHLPELYAKLGFKTAIVPKVIRRVDDWPKNIEIIEARSLRQALDAALMAQERPRGRKVA